MTKEQVIQEIQRWIIANGNQEITANVLRPILEDMVLQPNSLIGNIDNLSTTDKTSLVAAINEAASSSGFSGRIKIHEGTVHPNDNPNLSFSTGDFYLQYDANWIAFYQFNGSEWVPIENITREQVIAILGFEPLDSGGYTGTGQTLMNYINAINGILDVDDQTLDELREIVAYIKQNRDDLSNLSISNIAGLTAALSGKENTFSKNSAFNKNFGATAGTVKEGNWVPTWSQVSGKPTTFTPTPHVHSAADITSGILSVDRIPQLSPAKIVQNTTNRFVTDTEKALWNNKLSKRTPKIIPNTTQYTFVAEDFTTRALKFTANGGEEITAVLNAGVQPENGSLHIVIEGDCRLNLSHGTGVSALLPSNTLPKTLGRGSWIGSEYVSANVISWNGDLEGDIAGESIQNINQIPNRSYNELQDKPDIPDEPVGANFTGTTIKLNNTSGNNYNYGNFSGSISYIVEDIVVNGFARCFINRFAAPIVQNATYLANAGDEFMPNTPMEMVVESPDGTTVEYYFLKR